MRRSLALAFLCALLLPGAVRADETVSTFTLDGLSFISFGDQQIVLPDSGSTIVFRFETPSADGSVPFTIAPDDVSIPPVDLPDGSGTLRYALASPASGTLVPTSGGRRLSFTATVSATLSSSSVNGTYRYTIPFTTESTSASSVDGAQTLSVTGMRLVDGAWYGQIVGATTNKANAFPEPGTAVYTVLSGSFDQVP
jgi:hypothetical protein